MPIFTAHTSGVGTINMDKLNANLAVMDRPVLTTAQRTAAGRVWQEGQMVYDITLHKMCVKTAGSRWEVITSA